jgi:16S rRNA processing protein RimM
MDLNARYVTIGKISSAFGIKGWVRIAPFTRTPEDFLEYPDLMYELLGETYPLIVREAKIQKRSILARIQDIEDRNAAESLKNAQILIDEKDLPIPEEGEFYWKDLENLKVVTQQGELLGTVSHLIETGSNDVLVVKGERDRMIPFIYDDFIIQVDLPGQTITVDWDPDF